MVGDWVWISWFIEIKKEVLINGVYDWCYIWFFFKFLYLVEDLIELFGKIIICWVYL